MSKSKGQTVAARFPTFFDCRTLPEEVAGKREEIRKFDGQVIMLQAGNNNNGAYLMARVRVDSRDDVYFEAQKFLPDMTLDREAIRYDAVTSIMTPLKPLAFEVRFKA